MWAARSGLVDFLAGGIGGAGMVIMSHPSDTVKLLLQVGGVSGVGGAGGGGGGVGGGLGLRAAHIFWGSLAFSHGHVSCPVTLPVAPLRCPLPHPQPCWK